MKVSIITVAFNSVATIGDTIGSVISQTYSNIEYIVIDGGSTDGTIGIVKSFGSVVSKFVSEPDNGIFDAMNKGIALASGEIIGILNSDDFYHRNDTIAKIVETFNDTTIEATIADVRFVRPNNLNKTVRYYSSRGFTPKHFRFGFTPPHPTFFTYKKFYDVFGYYQPDYKVAADYELLIRFLYTNKLKYIYLPIDLVKMRTGGASKPSIKNTLLLNKEIIRGCRENGIYTNIIILYLKYFIKVFELVFTRNI